MRRTGILCTVALFMLISVIHRTLAFPNGAPEGTCDDLMPYHDEAKQLNGSDSPYLLVQQKATFEPDETFTVKLYAKRSYFRGFLVKALDEQGNDVGHFEPGANYKPMQTCSGATHKSRKNKKSVNFFWHAPADKSGSVRFKATVVHDYKLFYTDLWSTVGRARKGRPAILSPAFNMHQ